MQTSLLVLCKDTEALGVLSRTLVKVGITVEVCSGISTAMRAIGAHKYDGVVVDCDDLDGGVELLKSLRSQQATKSTIVFALVHGATSMSDGFRLGANFVLEKPLSFDRAYRCFRAAHGLMIGERRRYYRHPVEISVYLDFGGSTSTLTATTIDLSSGGMSIFTRTELPTEKQANLRFTLQGLNEHVEGTCRVVWTGEGRAGLEFLKLARIGKQALDRWLAERFEYSPQNSGRIPRN